MTRTDILAALLRERYGAPPLAPVSPEVGASGTHGIPGTEQSVAYVRRLAGYGWTRRQISATTGLTRKQVDRALRAGPSVESEAA